MSANSPHDWVPPVPLQDPRPPTADAPQQHLLACIPMEHVPSTHTVYAALFRDVKNAAFLHSQLLARNPAFEYALIDASTIVSTTQVLAGAFRALTSLVGGAGLRTPNVHSEIVFCLSPSNNITEAYRRYGISPETRDVIVVKVLSPTSSSSPESATPTTASPTATTPVASAPAQSSKPTSPEAVWAHLSTNVEGTPSPFTDDSIASLTSWSKVRKYYKLNGAAAVAGILDEGVLRKESEILILGSMALRGI